MTHYYILRISLNVNSEEKLKVEKIIKENPDNLDIINIHINNNLDAFEHVSDRLKNDFKFVKNIVSKDGTLIRFASTHLKNVFKIAKIAILQNINAYQFISNNLRINKDIINLIIDLPMYFGCDIIQLLDESLLTEDLIIKLLNKPISTYFIECIPKKLLTKEIVTKIIDKSPISLAHVPSELFNDDIFLNIIKETNYFEFLEEYIKEHNIKINTSIIIEALKLNDEYISYVSEELLNDKQFIMKIVAINGNFILKASMQLQNDRDVIICAINQCDKLVKYNNILLYNHVWNIKWNFNNFEKNYIEILENIKYMPFNENIGKLLDYMLSDYDLKKVIFEKYNNYLTDIISYNNDNNEEYIMLFEKYNIRFFNFNEVKPLDTDQTEEEIKKSYKECNKNKLILWY